VDYTIQILTYVGLNWILALGLYLAALTGQLSLGQAAFMAIGAYSSAVLTTHLHSPFAIALTLGALFSLVAGAMVAYSCLRLRGIYLALITYAIGEAVVGIIETIDYVGGPRGLIGIPMLTTPELVLTIAVVMTAACLVLLRSPAALALRALKGDDVAALAIGIPIDRLKLLLFSVGAMITGIGGALYAHYLGMLEPQAFGVSQSIRILAFVVVGGYASVFGPLVGALALTLLQEVVGELSLMFYGMAILVTVVLKPEGLIDRRLDKALFRFLGSLVGRLRTRAARL